MAEYWKTAKDDLYNYPLRTRKLPMSENSDITPEDADWLKELRSTFERDDSFNEFKLRIALPSSSDAFTGKTDIRSREVTNQRADEMDEFLTVAVAPYGLKLFHQLIGEVLKEFPSETVARVGGIKDWKGPAKSIKAEFLAEMRAALFKGLGFLETSVVRKGAPGGNESQGQTALAKEQLRETSKGRAQQHEPSPIDSREQWQKQEAERFEADGLALRCFAVKHMVALYNKAVDRARAYDRRYKSQHFGRIVDGKYQCDYEKIRLGPEWNAIKGPSYGYEGFCLEKNLQLDGTLSYEVVRRRQPTVGNYAMFILNGMAKEKTPEAVVGAMMGGVIASMIAVATRRPYANSMSRDEAMQLEVGRHLTDILSKRPPNGPPGGLGGPPFDPPPPPAPPSSSSALGPKGTGISGADVADDSSSEMVPNKTKRGGSGPTKVVAIETAKGAEIDKLTSFVTKDFPASKEDENVLEPANIEFGEGSSDLHETTEQTAISTALNAESDRPRFEYLDETALKTIERLQKEKQPCELPVDLGCEGEKAQQTTKKNRHTFCGMDLDKPIVRPHGPKIVPREPNSSKVVESCDPPKIDTEAIKRAMKHGACSERLDRGKNRDIVR